MLLPDAAIEILREARWSPDAVRAYELFSGGFFWSDERLREVARICVNSENWAFREVIAYRASLIQNDPRPEVKEPWDQLRAQCPDWPGFRPERLDPSLASELEQEYAKISADIDDVDRGINERMAEKRNNGED